MLYYLDWTAPIQSDRIDTQNSGHNGIVQNVFFSRTLSSIFTFVCSEASQPKCLEWIDYTNCVSPVFLGPVNYQATSLRCQSHGKRKEGTHRATWNQRRKPHHFSTPQIAVLNLIPFPWIRKIVGIPSADLYLPTYVLPDFTLSWVSIYVLFHSGFPRWMNYTHCDLLLMSFVASFPRIFSLGDFPGASVVHNHLVPRKPASRYEPGSKGLQLFENLCFTLCMRHEVSAKLDDLSNKWMWAEFNAPVWPFGPKHILLISQLSCSRLSLGCTWMFLGSIDFGIPCW